MLTLLAPFLPYAMAGTLVVGGALMFYASHLSATVDRQKVAIALAEDRNETLETEAQGLLLDLEARESAIAARDASYEKIQRRLGNTTARLRRFAIGTNDPCLPARMPVNVSDLLRGRQTTTGDTDAANGAADTPTGATASR